MALLKDPGYHNVLSILLKRLFSLLLETENEKKCIYIYDCMVKNPEYWAKLVQTPIWT